MQNLKFIFLISIVSTLLLSCSENYEIIPSEKPILLSSDNSLSLIGMPIELKATQDGEDITNDVTFYANEEQLSSNVFVSNEVGEFVVNARYEGLTSEPLIIKYHDGSEINFKKRVLIEDYTGTWCGYCARVAFAVEEVLQNTNNAVLVGIHRDSSNPSDATYDPYNYDTSAIENNLDAVGYPKGYLNRNISWQSPEPENINQVLQLTQGENPKLGIAMSNEVINNSINLDVNIKIAKTFSDLKLVVYVLENGLIYEQKNYTNYFGGENPIEDFEHNHVLRNCVTNLTGDNINMEEFTNDVYTKTFNFTIPSNIENTNNIEFVAFVIDGSGTAINVRKASLNQVQEFEEI